MEEYINKYFELILSNLQRHLNNPSFPDEEKAKINIRVELIKELRDNVSWQFKSPIEKQIGRIQWLAALRRSEAPMHVIRKQENSIQIYELIKVTMPYLEALNSDKKMEQIINFANSLSDRIDLAGSTYTGVFPERAEIEKIFRIFFEVIKPARGNGEMFKECYEKIEYLHQELLKL